MADFERATDGELREALRLAERATLGPWTTDGGQVVMTEYPVDGAEDGDSADVCEVLHYGQGAGGGALGTGTATFIAASRTLVPKLAQEAIENRASLAESNATIRRLAAEVEAAQTRAGLARGEERERVRRLFDHYLGDVPINSDVANRLASFVRDLANGTDRRST